MINDTNRNADDAHTQAQSDNVRERLLSLTDTERYCLTATMSRVYHIGIRGQKQPPGTRSVKMLADRLMADSKFIPGVRTVEGLADDRTSRDHTFADDWIDLFEQFKDTYDSNMLPAVAARCFDLAERHRSALTDDEHACLTEAWLCGLELSQLPRQEIQWAMQNMRLGLTPTQALACHSPGLPGRLA